MYVYVSHCYSPLSPSLGPHRECPYALLRYVTEPQKVPEAPQRPRPTAEAGSYCEAGDLLGTRHRGISYLERGCGRTGPSERVHGSGQCTTACLRNTV